MFARLWLIAFAVACVLWLAVMVDRMGVWYVGGFIALAFAFRYFGVDK